VFGRCPSTHLREALVFCVCVSGKDISGNNLTEEEKRKKGVDNGYGLLSLECQCLAKILDKKLVNRIRFQCLLRWGSINDRVTTLL
jgi:hypothetical protein